MHVEYEYLMTWAWQTGAGLSTPNRNSFIYQFKLHLIKPYKINSFMAYFSLWMFVYYVSDAKLIIMDYIIIWIVIATSKRFAWSIIKDLAHMD